MVVRAEAPLVGPQLAAGYRQIWDRRRKLAGKYQLRKEKWKISAGTEEGKLENISWSV